MDPTTWAALADAAKAGGASNCTTTVLTDQERLAEHQTVCELAAGVQTIRAALRPIDDRTNSSEVLSSMPGVRETLLKSKVTYRGGFCTAAERKPSAEQCAAMATTRQENAAAGGGAQCAQYAQYPAAARGAVRSANGQRHGVHGDDRAALQVTRRPTLRG